MENVFEVDERMKCTSVRLSIECHSFSSLLLNPIKWEFLLWPVECWTWITSSHCRRWLIVDRSVCSTIQHFFVFNCQPSIGIETERSSFDVLLAMSSRFKFVFGVYGDLSTSFQGASTNQLIEKRSVLIFQSKNLILSPLERSLCGVHAQSIN